MREPLVLFPMNVETPLGALSGCKVYVAHGRVEVYRHPGEPELEAGVHTLTMRPERGVRALIITDQGAEWTIRKAAGCGCGDPLKGWDPRRRQRAVSA